MSVVQLSGANFSQVTSSGTPWLVSFSADWCGPCKALKPEFSAAASQLKGVAQLGYLRADQEKQLSAKYGVKGYPTVIFFHGGKVEMYSGQRKAAAIVKFIQARAGTMPKSPSAMSKSPGLVPQKPSNIPTRQKSPSTIARSHAGPAKSPNCVNGVCSLPPKSPGLVPLKPTNIPTRQKSPSSMSRSPAGPAKSPNCVNGVCSLPPKNVSGGSVTVTGGKRAALKGLLAFVKK